MEVLRSKFGLLGYFTAITADKPLPDSDDEAFLEVAIASVADYLITGNARHFPVRLRSGIQAVSPAEFVEILSDKASLISFCCGKPICHPERSEAIPKKGRQIFASLRMTNGR